MTAALTPSVLVGYVAGAALSTLKFCLVVVPLVALWEVLKGLGFLRRRGRMMAPLAARLHFSPRALFPLAAGMFLGLIYGAGILISEARDRHLSGRDVLVLSLFLSACHAVIEDTLLFVVLGGSWWWILAPRVLLAVATTWMAGHVYGRAKARGQGPPPGLV